SRCATRRRRAADQPLLPHRAWSRPTASKTTSAHPPHPARPRRSRLRTVLPLAVAAWLVLVIWLLTLLAGATNGLVVLLVLVAGLVLGSAVIKRAGRRAVKNLGETLQQQQGGSVAGPRQSEEHTSELQSRENLVCRLLLEKKK